MLSEPILVPDTIEDTSICSVNFGFSQYLLQTSSMAHRHAPEILVDTTSAPRHHQRHIGMLSEPISAPDTIEDTSICSVDFGLSQNGTAAYFGLLLLSRHSRGNAFSRQPIFYRGRHIDRQPNIHGARQTASRSHARHTGALREAKTPHGASELSSQRHRKHTVAPRESRVATSCGFWLRSSTKTLIFAFEQP